MKTEIITKIITKDILPNIEKYKKENIILYLEANHILIEYQYITYKFKLNKNNILSLFNEKELLNTYPTDIKFDRVIEYIKNIHKI